MKWKMYRNRVDNFVVYLNCWVDTIYFWKVIYDKQIDISKCFIFNLRVIKQWIHMKRLKSFIKDM